MWQIGVVKEDNPKNRYFARNPLGPL